MNTFIVPEFWDEHRLVVHPRVRGKQPIIGRLSFCWSDFEDRHATARTYCYVLFVLEIKKQTGLVSRELPQWQNCIPSASDAALKGIPNRSVETRLRSSSAAARDTLGGSLSWFLFTLNCWISEAVSGEQEGEGGTAEGIDPWERRWPSNLPT